MKLLLDENLPRQLRSHIPEHHVFTLGQMGWLGKKNGELMLLMIENNFDGMITMDKGIVYQQNLNKYSFTIFILEAKSNTIDTLMPLVPNLLLALNKIQKHGTVYVRR
jgi:hypothetical protein